MLTAIVKAHHVRLKTFDELDDETKQDFDYVTDPTVPRFAQWTSKVGTLETIDVSDMFEGPTIDDIRNGTWKSWFHTFQSDSFFSGFGVNFHDGMWQEWEDPGDCDDYDCVSVTLVMS